MEISPVGFWITTLIAILGLGVALFTLGWTVFRDLGHHGKLRVQCSVMNIIGGIEDPKKVWLNWNITNIGKERVIVTHIGGRLIKETSFLINPGPPYIDVPKTLEPGDYMSAMTHDLSSLSSETVNLCAWDSLGRVWEAPANELTKLKRDFESGVYVEINKEWFRVGDGPLEVKI